MISCCTIVALILAGCKTSTDERAFITMAPRQLPQQKAVRYSGQYRLYSNPPRHPTTQNSTPVVETHLSKGELLGFARGESGNPLAIIRNEEKPLPNAAYTWTMQPDPGQFDVDRSIFLVVCVIGLIGIGLAATIPAPFGPFN